MNNAGQSDYKCWHDVSTLTHGNNNSKGAYQKSKLTSWTGHFEIEIDFFREFSLKTHPCYAYYHLAGHC